MGDVRYAFRYSAYVITIERKVEDLWSDSWSLARPFGERDFFKCHIDSSGGEVRVNNEYMTQPGSATHTIYAWNTSVTARIGAEDRIYVKASPDLIAFYNDKDRLPEGRWLVFDVIDVHVNYEKRPLEIEISVVRKQPIYSESRKAWVETPEDLPGVIRDYPDIDRDDPVGEQDNTQYGYRPEFVDRPRNYPPFRTDAYY